MAYKLQKEKSILERSPTEYVLFSTRFRNFPVNREKQCLPYSAFKEQPFLFLVDVPVTPFIATLSRLHLDKQWTLTCPGKQYSFLVSFCPPQNMLRSIINKEINTLYICTRVDSRSNVNKQRTVRLEAERMGAFFESCWNWLLPILLYFYLCVQSKFIFWQARIKARIKMSRIQNCKFHSLKRKRQSHVLFFSIQWFNLALFKKRLSQLTFYGTAPRPNVFGSLEYVIPQSINVGSNVM